MSSKQHVGSVADMTTLAQEIAPKLRGGDILWLFGELGAGKTTFTQALGKLLGVTQPIVSPTFTLVNEYAAAGPVREFVHIDLYRLSSTDAAADLTIKEVLHEAAREDRVTVVEWADRLPTARLTAGWRVVFEHGGSEQERVVTVSSL